MTKTLSSTYTSLYTLSGMTDNPTTITAAGLLQAGLYADSLSADWTITNAGRVLTSTPDRTALVVPGAGTVTNTGRIFSSTGDGVGLGFGTLINDGIIASSTIGPPVEGVGVDFFGGGYAFNAASAAIVGEYAGII